MSILTVDGIPENIGRSEVEGALRRIDIIGVAERRESREWDLVYNGRRYPPKYVISIANGLANEIELDPSGFRSKAARRRLKALGFSIARKRE